MSSNWGRTTCYVAACTAATARTETRFPGVRGRIDVAATVKRNERIRARAVCEFDELTPDVPHNQILRATARGLLAVPDLAVELRHRLATLIRRLAGVSDTPLSPALFRAVQLYRGQRFYRFLLAVCRLVMTHLIPDAAGQGSHFREFEIDERRMRKLFERFVRNFYQREQQAYKLCGRKLRWSASGDVLLLPTMQTDVTLRRRDRKTVVETKYTANQLQHHFDKKAVRSDHLYQLFAYLQNLAVRSPAGCRVGGVLLYPRVGPGPDVRCEIHGHPVRVTTLDLSQEWDDIRRQLLALLD